MSVISSPVLIDALGVPFALPMGEAVDQVNVGDLWTVDAASGACGVVLIAAVRPSHVLAWPMTNPSRHAAAPAFPVSLDSGDQLIAWPDAEFGLPTDSLDLRIAPSILADNTLQAIRWSMNSVDPVDGHRACPGSDSPEAHAAFEAVCAWAWSVRDGRST